MAINQIIITRRRVHNQTFTLFPTQDQDSRPHYQQSQIAYNYRLSNLLAGIGRGQLDRLDGAQIYGRNTLTWEEKFKLDVWYVDIMSFWLDLKILALTVWKILKGEEIREPGQLAAEEFRPQITQIDADLLK